MSLHRITGETRLLAVIGHPVSHSLSPFIHNRLADTLDLPYAYLAFDILPDSIGQFMDAARSLGIAGFNVTMPLKERILPHMDGLSMAARECGAVNTVLWQDGKFTGHNTDGEGFILSLGRAGFHRAGDALILGAGGAARAVALALREAGWNVSIASRRNAMPDFPWIPWEDIRYAAANKLLVVNATPLGMPNHAPFPDVSFLDALPPNALVYDLLYEPRETLLLRAAKQKGLETMNGLPHLMCQAVLSFALFTGVSPGENLVQAVFREMGEETLGALET